MASSVTTVTAAEPLVAGSRSHTEWSYAFLQPLLRAVLTRNQVAAGAGRPQALTEPVVACAGRRRVRYRRHRIRRTGLAFGRLFTFVGKTRR
jgi:hypothetical protein